MTEEKCRVFISYARQGKGRDYVNELKEAAEVLLIPAHLWADQDTQMGENWQDEIDQQLKDAAAAILLIDYKFLSSSYINDIELPEFRAKHEAGGGKPGAGPGESSFLLIPILIEVCPYEKRLPWINTWPMEPENSMRNQVDRDKQRFRQFLTLGDLDEGELATFKYKLGSRLSKHCEERKRRVGEISVRDRKPLRQSRPDRLPLLDRKSSSYLVKGRDLISYVDLQLDFSHTELDLYRVDLKYYFRYEREDSGGFRASGRVQVPWHDDQRKIDIADLLGTPLFSASHQYYPAMPEDAEADASNLVRESGAGEGTLLRRLSDAIYKAHELELPLQLRIGLSPSAGELSELPWERLTLPDHEGVALCLQDGVLFSRVAMAADDEPVESQTRARASLRALCVYCDVGRPAGQGGDPLTHKGIVQAMANGLDALMDPGEYTTRLLRPEPEVLYQRLEELDTYDVLYLACEAICSDNEYRLRFKGRDVGRAELAQRVRRAVVPRLVILVPAQQLDGFPEERKSIEALLHFASVFTQLGAAAVLTTQGGMPPERWQHFFSEFIAALASHGHIVGAAAQARASLSGTDDWWKPVLMTRIKSARLWYDSGFVSTRPAHDNWERIKSRLTRGTLCPVLGPGFYYRIQQARLEIAREMADEFAYPLSSYYRIHLPAVVQFVKILAADEELFFAGLESKLRRRFLAIDKPAGISGKEALQQLAYKVAIDVLRKQPTNPYNLLARVPARLYLTANLDPFLQAALDLAKEAAPTDTKRRLESYEVFDLTNVDPAKPDREGESELPIFDFSTTRPLVVQFYGNFDNLNKAVISEDDHLEFLLTFSERLAGADYAPLTGVLANSDLVFLGFNWNSIEFRVLFRALHKYANRTRATSFHIAVQIDPDDDETLNPEKALEYLQRYFAGEGQLQRANISIYWGSTVDFLKQLFDRSPSLE